MESLTEREIRYLELAIELAGKGMKDGKGGPFGCLVVLDDTIIGQGSNMVLSTNDPTAHAEVVAIRAACEKLGHYQLAGCEIYTNCEPCPMCLGAIYWARPRRVVFANTRQQAAAIDFDDAFIYGEINKDPEQRAIPFIHYPHPEAEKLFGEWDRWEGKTKY